MGRKNRTKKKGGANSRSKSKSRSRSKSRKTQIQNLDIDHVVNLAMEVYQNTQSILKLIDEMNVIKRKISDAERRTSARLKVA